MPVPGVASGAVSHRDGGAVRGFCNSSSSSGGGLVLSLPIRSFAYLVVFILDVLWVGLDDLTVGGYPLGQLYLHVLACRPPAPYIPG